MIFFSHRYTGSYLRREYGLELGRISGLDPAEPHFEWAHPITRLDKDDAYYVDVIHTDASPIMNMGLGMFQTCGHLDFYPNGGKLMNGCDRSILGSLAEVLHMPVTNTWHSSVFIPSCCSYDFMTLEVLRLDEED